MQFPEKKNGHVVFAWQVRAVKSLKILGNVSGGGPPATSKIEGEVSLMTCCHCFDDGTEH